MNANQIATRCSCSTSAAPCASLRASRGAAEARGIHQSRANLIDRRRQRRYELRDSLVARAAEGEEKPQAPAGISEDVLARLRAAESEAAMLREQLAKVQPPTEGTSSSPSSAPTANPPGRRIDGDGLSRESPFAPRSAEGSWLSESQVDFFTGGGAGETEGLDAESSKTSEAAASEVKRRLFLGGIAAAGAAAFALVPTDALRASRPQKPLFFYLTPLLRAGPLLDEAGLAASEAEWPRLAEVLGRIQGSPCDVEKNLRAAAAHPSLSPSQRTKLQAIARDAIEYVASIDYNSYYESVGGSGLKGGAREKAFAEFSSKAAAAAKKEITNFLEAMPRDDFEAAKSQFEALSSMA